MRYAIRQQYPTIDRNANFDISKDYIEKIIQIPITLPELSAKDLENYLMLLVVEKYLPEDSLSQFINAVQKDKLLVNTTNIAKNQVNEIITKLNIKLPDDIQLVFSSELSIIDEVRIVVSTSLKGNPRQAKRFLNAFSIKKELAELYFGDAINIKCLAKLLTLYMINQDSFKTLQMWSSGYTGEIKELQELVNKAENNIDSLDQNWKDKKLVKWLLSEPKDLYKYDLSQYFYLTRDLAPERDDVESRLNAYEKKAMFDIVNYPDISAEQVIKILHNNVGINMDEIIKVVGDNFLNGALSLNKLHYFVKHYPKYITTIYKFISNKAADMQLGDVPALKQLYSQNKKEFNIIMIKLPEKIQVLVKGE